MTTAGTIDRLLTVAYHSTGGSSSDVTVEETERGTWIVKGLKVFKAGTFKDSIGVQRTWEPEHLQQMVFHFHLLKDRDVLPNVPVRTDHWSGVNGVVGYFVNLYADEAFLFSDIEFTEPEAYEKWARQTFRSRSLEVGFYETNDEAVYWPVVVGLAFVDLPAVEGLHSRAAHNKESNMAGEQGGTNQGANQQGGTGAGAGSGTSDAAAQQGGDATQAQQAGTQGAPAGGVTPPATDATGGAPAPGTPAPGTPAPGTPAPGTPAQNFGATGAFVFQVNGQSTSDFAAVQRHVLALETFVRETRETGRKDFVNGLASGEAPKIAAAQVESLTAFALSLNDEQYKTWQESWGAAPSSSLFGQHGNGVTNPEGQTGTISPADDVEIAAETIQNHLRANMKHEKIKATASYKKLLAAKPDHPLLASIL